MKFVLDPILNVGGRSSIESFFIKQIEALIQVLGGKIEVPDVSLGVGNVRHPELTSEWTARRPRIVTSDVVPSAVNTLGERSVDVIVEI